MFNRLTHNCRNLEEAKISFNRLSKMDKRDAVHLFSDYQKKSHQVTKRHEGNLPNETNKQNSLKGYRDIPGGPVVKILPCNAQDTGSVPGWGTKVPHVSE